MTEARLTRIEIDGIEIPVADAEQLTLPDEEAVAQVFEALEKIEEAERPGFILATSTSRAYTVTLKGRSRARNGHRA
jgi:hypothetical protein